MSGGTSRYAIVPDAIALSRTVEVTAAGVSATSSTLKTADKYTITVTDATDAVRRLLNGEASVRRGFETVALFFG